MKITVVCDSYKGCLSAEAVCAAIAEGIWAAQPQAQVTCVPLADGGEGTVRCFSRSCCGVLRHKTVRGVFFADTDAEYAVLPNGTAVIESAAASGISTVDKNELNPLLATTYGTGELICDAVEKGAKRIILGLGGSATNDGGMGALAALGLVFRDAAGNVLPPVGASLSQVAAIEKTEAFARYRDVEILLACDVENPFYGETGAAYIFAPQKGADSAMVRQLDSGLQSFAGVVRSYTGIALQTVRGAGAAGGLCGGLYAFLNCSLQSGYSLLCAAAHLEETIRHTDLVITGEGRTDRQTQFGKLPKRVCDTATAFGVPCVLLSGNIAEDTDALQMGFSAAFQLQGAGMSREYAIQNARQLLKTKAAEIAREWN